MAKSKNVVYAAFAGNAIIAVMKFVAAGMTGSSAMFSEGIHSVVDSGNQLLLIYGMNASQRPADKRHPFGYSAEIYFWAFVVAILIFAVGAGLAFYEGYEQITSPHPITNAGISYAVLIAALLIESAAWYVAFRAIQQQRAENGMKQSFVKAIRQSKDPAIFTVLLEDSAACIGLLIALAGVFAADVYNMPIFDGIASFAIGVLLAVVAIFLAYETKALLIGESAGQHVIDGIREAIRSNSAIIRCHELNTMHLGPTHVIVSIVAEFEDRMTTPEIEKSIAELEAEIQRQHPTVKTIAVEPATSA
ncbi:MAG: cation diffusion facilitator family transporter [Hyphomicrobiales bacterium]|nr:cation diffusion facilitator family transporter [Hyphomicrobiales bacterium]